MVLHERQRDSHLPYLADTYHYIIQIWPQWLCLHRTQIRVTIHYLNFYKINIWRLSKHLIVDFYLFKSKIRVTEWHRLVFFHHQETDAFHRCQFKGLKLFITNKILQCSRFCKILKYLCASTQFLVKNRSKMFNNIFL